MWQRKHLSPSDNKRLHHKENFKGSNFRLFLISISWNLGKVTKACSHKKGSNKSTKVYFSNFCDFITLEKFLSRMFLPLKYISNIKVNILIFMACIALHKCDYLFPKRIYYLLFWYFPCLKFLCDDILWVVLQVNAQSGHDKASFSSTKSGVYISTLSPRNCPCKPWEFCGCRLSCLFACKRDNNVDKYFKCNKNSHNTSFNKLFYIAQFDSSVSEKIT